MIQPKPEGNNPIRSYGILVGVRIEDGETTVDDVMECILARISAIPGADDVIVEALGEIDDFDLAEDSQALADQVKPRDHGEQ